MFNHLIESGSHRHDLARKSRFFLGTLGLYGLLLACAGIASVQAFNAHLGTQNYEVVFLPPPVIPDAEQPTPPDSPAPARPAANGGGHKVLPQRKDLYADINTVTATPTYISTAPSLVRVMPPGGVLLTGVDIDPTGGGYVGPKTDGYVGVGTGDAPVRVRVPVTEDPAPVVKPTIVATPAKPKEQLRMSPGVLAGKIIDKVVPAYPAVAKAARVSGPVNVEIVIDERGTVVSARAVGGPVLLRVAAEQAARQTRFSPTRLGEQAVKVSGVITFNFVLN